MSPTATEPLSTEPAPPTRPRRTSLDPPHSGRSPTFGAIGTQVDERGARRALRRQIAKLEGELDALFCSAYPRQGFDFTVPGRGGGARLLGLSDLEALRDDLAERLHDVRRSLSERTYVEERNRRRIEEMLLEPEKHKWVRVANEDIGEPGCKHWHVVPRLGPLGMLMGWWRVRISSGCPLAARVAPAPTPPAPPSLSELPSDENRVGRLARGRGHP